MSVYQSYFEAPLPTVTDNKQIVIDVCLQWGIDTRHADTLLKACRLVMSQGDCAWKDVRDLLHSKNIRFTQTVANAINQATRKIVAKSTLHEQHMW